MATFRGRWTDRLTAVFAAAALFALLAPTAGLLVDVQLAGWSADHGHLGGIGALTAHSHPYDDHHDADPQDASAADDGASNVGFTLADDAGAAALVLAREPAPLPSMLAPAVGSVLATDAPPGVSAELVPTPPPRA